MEKVEQDSLRDRWFTAEEARDYGFVDQILTDVAAVTPARRPARRAASGLGGATMSSYTIPSVVEKTLRGERAVDIYSRLLTDRIVYIGTEIDDGVANVVIAQLLHLESESPDVTDQPLPQLARRLGHGDARDLRHHAVRPAPPVGTTCVGQAASSAAVLLAGGEPGQRMVLPHARVVLHQPSGGGQGTLPDLALQAKEIVRLRAEMEEILSGTPARTSSGCARTPDRDLILTAQEAVAYGLADGVLDSRKNGVSASAGSTGPLIRPISARVTRLVRSTSRSPRAPATAPSISELGSLRPRSTSERYCVETPASLGHIGEGPPGAAAPRAARSRPPRATAARGRAGSGRSGRGNAITSPMTGD